MIILNKKRIVFLTLSFVFSICFYSFSNFENKTDINFTNKNINKDITSTSSIPSANHVVILDAGHGFPDGGAVSNDN